jgi:hypothetical protein
MNKKEPKFEAFFLRKQLELETDQDPMDFPNVMLAHDEVRPRRYAVFTLDKNEEPDIHIGYIQFTFVDHEKSPGGGHLDINFKIDTYEKGFERELDRAGCGMADIIGRRLIKQKGNTYEKSYQKDPTTVH